MYQVEWNFRKFITLYRVNESQWKPFIDDKGEGDPPVEYLAAFEEGLREYGHNVHSLGTRPFRSRTYWGKNVDKWRKREAYIALGRAVLGYSAGYKQWDNFSFQDYVSRAVMSKTFLKRHLPLSDGQDEIHFKGKLTFPWSKYEDKKKKTRVKQEETAVSSSTSSTGVVPSMIFDIELGCMVPR